MSETSDRDGGPYTTEQPILDDDADVHGRDCNKWSCGGPSMTQQDIWFGPKSWVMEIAEHRNDAYLSGQRTAAARVQELEGMVTSLKQVIADLACPSCAGNGEIQTGEESSDQCESCYATGICPSAEVWHKALDAFTNTAAAAKEHDARIAREARREGAEEMREMAASLLVESSCDKDDKYAAAIRAIPIEGEEQET